MAVTTSQLRAFVAVVDDGGFSAAAKSLGISQAAVSHAVAALERTLGSPVLGRDGALVLTPFGQRILGPARMAVAAIGAIAACAEQHHGRPAGSVRLAAPPTVCQGLLPALMAHWRAEFPSIQIALFEGGDDEVAGWLADDMVDLAVLVDPPPGPGVLVARDAFHALLHRDHPLAGESALAVADLDGDPFLLSIGGCERYIRKLYRRAQVPLRPAHRAREMATLLAMVRSGVGVSIVPGIAQAMLDPSLVLVPLRDRITRSMVLTGRDDRGWRPAASALIAATRGETRAGAEVPVGPAGPDRLVPAPRSTS
ncbi:LysR family transcriptional regulator [Frankia sp. CiP3]|uniref:LysR family transcriptional regulator n=1 Tax=Frankia sp. CiP3 TaxID=2880971 RepID=UPI001EF44FBD|nr:LysR family transcriptional regulator [Frankia sp. CiP3]